MRRLADRVSVWFVLGVITAAVLIVGKTGTLAEGRPVLRAVVAASGFTESEMLRLAASLQRASKHPLAADGRAGDGPVLGPGGEQRAATAGVGSVHEML
jgi:hypothetical protein